jgi:hypothetical protein
MTVAVGVVVAAFLAQDAPKKAPTTPTIRAARATSDKPIRVLFIGNSLTYMNDLPAQIQALARASYPRGRPLRYESVTPGGRTLKQHWDEGKAAPKIAEGGWDYVVLQEQSQIPFIDRTPMYQYARLFDQEIKKVGARTVLYMTFPLKNKFDDGDLLPEIYLTIGKELGAIVVPVDLAWHEAARRDPRIALYAPDNAHPAAAGTYLAACCFALTLWGAPARPFPATRLRARQGARPLVSFEQSQAYTLQMAASVVASQSANTWAQAAAHLSAKGQAATRAATPSPAGEVWVDLFNGRDTSGWIDAHSLWTVESGTLIGKGGLGFLDTERTDFANFHLQAEAIINDGGNSGVAFRAQPNDGYEAQIEADGNDRAKTGSLYICKAGRYSAKALVNPSPVPANQWFTMDVVADGFHVRISVDGTVVADYRDNEHIASAGRIRLQVGNARTVVKFRKVRIRETR